VGEDPARRPFTIDEFTMADYEQVATIWHDAGPGLPARPSDERDQIALKLGRDPDLFLVAREGGPLSTVVGCVLGGWDGRRAYVYHLAVAARWRRRGVASALMDQLEERFRAKGALKCKAEVYRTNEASIAFLRRRGWSVAEPLYAVGKELVPGGAPGVDW
jgi:ribosomal protein S18 acetylase RimI-like enzyme